tara:strand:+ start:622 stop:1035 length:414 start_codon:yes stop_codon:yes gene_type:complete
MAALVVKYFRTPVLATGATDRVRSFYAAGNNLNFPPKTLTHFAMDRYKDPNRSPGLPAGLSDSESMIASFVALETGFSGGITTLNIMALIKGDRAMAYWIWNVKHTGSFIGMSTSGREIEMNGVDVFRLKFGKFADR